MISSLFQVWIKFLQPFANGHQWTACSLLPQVIATWRCFRSSSACRLSVSIGFQKTTFLNSTSLFWCTVKDTLPLLPWVLSRHSIRFHIGRKSSTTSSCANKRQRLCFRQGESACRSGFLLPDPTFRIIDSNNAKVWRIYVCAEIFKEFHLFVMTMIDEHISRFTSHRLYWIQELNLQNHISPRWVFKIYTWDFTK